MPSNILQSEFFVCISRISFIIFNLFNVKFYKYTISHLCLLLPSSFPIIISIYGDKDEKFIVNYNGETLPFTVNSEEQFYLPNLKIIVQLKLL